MEASLPNYGRPRKTLQQFRARPRRVPVHPLELGLLWIVAAHLVFLPWALGAMHSWAQWSSLGFSLAGLAVALIPRNYTEELTGSTGFRLFTWPKLIRFPLFWLGLGLLGLVMVQALNPAWAYQTNGKGWWMVAIPHREGLPTGVIASFELWDQWRELVIFCSAWLTLGSVWIGFTRRRTAVYLLVILAANGFVLAAVGTAQRLEGAHLILWHIPSSNPGFFATFIYKNHGAGYLFLTLAVSGALAAWYHLRGLRALEKSSPGGVLLLSGGCIALSICFSNARGITLVTIPFVVICAASYVLHRRAAGYPQRRSIISLVLVLIIAIFLKFGETALRLDEAIEHIREGLAKEDLSLSLRERATVASLEMLRENWKGGIGAGSFRYIFPIYQHRHTELVVAPNQHLMFWEHAHNDILEIPIELGATGMLLLAAGFVWWLALLVRGHFWRNPLPTFLFLGMLTLLAAAWWDFPFQCPAILITWLTLGVVTVLVTDLDRPAPDSIERAA